MMLNKAFKSVFEKFTLIIQCTHMTDYYC